MIYLQFIVIFGMCLVIFMPVEVTFTKSSGMWILFGILLAGATLDLNRSLYQGGIVLLATIIFRFAYFMAWFVVKTALIPNREHERMRRSVRGKTEDSSYCETSLGIVRDAKGEPRWHFFRTVSDAFLRKWYGKFFG